MKTRESVRRVTRTFSKNNQLRQRLIGISHCIICNFSRQRKFAAIKLSNQRLLRIHFHTFRHWKATTEYQKTKDILHVMRVLGRKSIQNTLVYTQMVEFKNDEYISATASTIEDEMKLVEAGFKYVTEKECAKLFRKRK